MYAIFNIIEKKDKRALKDEKDAVRKWFENHSRKVIYEHDSPKMFAIGFVPDGKTTVLDMERFCRDLKYMVLSRFTI